MHPRPTGGIESRGMRVVGVDIGGTFTDFMLYNTESEAVHVHKVRSTPEDPGRAMVSGLVELCGHAGIEPAQVDAVFHGTTVATNAVLEHRGAEAGMLTTKGFRDVVHIGRHQRPQHYSIMQDIPWQAQPFVKRRHRHVVSERIVPPTGDVLETLNEDEVRAAARALKEAASSRSRSAFSSPISTRSTSGVQPRSSPRRSLVRSSRRAPTSSPSSASSSASRPRA